MEEIIDISNIFEKKKMLSNHYLYLSLSLLFSNPLERRIL